MADWMTMSAADLSPYEAWQQYRESTGFREQVGGINLYSIFLAGIEYAEADR